MRLLTLLLVTSIVTALSGCKDQTDAAPTPATTVTSPVEPIAPPALPAPVGDPAAILKVTPNPIDLCAQEKKLTTVRVEWDLSKTKVRNYSLWVEAPGLPRKLWVESFKPLGNKETGNWVRDLTKFTITTPDGTEVVSTVVNSVPCN